MRVPFILLVIGLLLVSKLGIAQKNGIVGLSQDLAMDKYEKQFHLPNSYIKGRKYIPYYSLNIDCPLLEALFSSADLTANGILYKDVNIGYDMNTDQLITTPKHSPLVGKRIILNELYIDSCAIHYPKRSYTFHYLTFKKQGKYLKDGYYEYLHKGKYVTLIKHRTKEYQNEAITKYNHSPLYFIFIKNEYHRIKSKSKFLKLFPQHRKAIKTQLRLYRTSFRSLSRIQLQDLISHIEKL